MHRWMYKLLLTGPEHPLSTAPRPFELHHRQIRDKFDKLDGISDLPEASKSHPVTLAVRDNLGLY